MNSTKSGIIVLGISMVPYLLVAWGVTEFIDGHTRTFWLTLTVLLAARLFFAFIECLGGILVWRLYGRELAVGNFLRVLRENKFPKRYYQHDDFLNYLSRVESDEASPQALKFEVTAWNSMLLMWENSGVLVGARMHAATEIALERYSPRRLAPVMKD
jgi:hypothetical protein